MKLINEFDAQYNALCIAIDRILEIETNLFKFSVDDENQKISESNKINELNNKLKQEIDQLNLLQGSEIARLHQEKKSVEAEINRYVYIMSNNEIFGKLTPTSSSAIDQLKNITNDYFNIENSKIKSSTIKKIAELEHQFNKEIIYLKQNILKEKEKLVNELNKLIGEDIPALMRDFNEFYSSSGDKEINWNNTLLSNNKFSPYINLGKCTSRFENKDLPIIVPFLGKKNIIIFYNNGSKEMAEQIQANFILTSLLSCEPGKVVIELFDMKDLGKSFSYFKGLDKSILNQGLSIEKLFEYLKKSEERINNFASNYLVKNINSVLEYNQQVNKKNQLPLYVSVIWDLNKYLDDNLFKGLKKIIEKGVNTGCQTIILANTEDSSDDFSDEFYDYCDEHNDILNIYLNRLSNHGQSFFMIDGFLKGNFLFSSRFKPQICPPEHITNVVDFINDRIRPNANSNTIPYKAPEIEKWYSNSNSYSKVISAVVGIKENTEEIQTIDLFSDDTQCMALLSGGTGSGKSNFMKVFITSLCIDYTPEELELYLVDLKSGVSFSPFKVGNLPHVENYCFDADNEMISSVIDNLIQEMIEREEKFFENEVSDIISYNKKFSSGIKMKRILLIIDEFDSIYNAEDPLSEVITNNLNILAKRARSSGLNILLSTQNFEKASGRIKFSEFQIRILLRSLAAAAAALLPGSNKGYKKLKQRGEGLVNNTGGEDDSQNLYFQTFYINDLDLNTKISEINNILKAKNISSNKRLLYSSKNIAKIESNKYLLAEHLESRPESNKHIIWLGERTNISMDHFNFTVSKKPENNVFICGGDKSLTIPCILSILASLTNSHKPESISFIFLNTCDKETDISYSISEIFKQTERYYDSKVLDEKNMQAELRLLDEECDNRNKNPYTANQPIYLFLTGTENAVSLYSKDIASASELNSLLARIIKNGPAANIYTVFECNRLKDFLKIFTQKSMIENFQHRILFHMSKNDSMDICETAIANKMFDPSVSFTKHKGIYFNSELGRDHISKFKAYLHVPIDIAVRVYYGFEKNEIVVTQRTGYDKQVIVTNNSSEILMNSTIKQTEINMYRNLEIDSIGDIVIE